MTTIFVKERNKRGGFEIFEGEPRPKNVLNITRFICTIGQQETEKETEKLADFVLKKLNTITVES